MIEAREVTKAYGEAVALRDVSFSVQPGERVALLGRNGAGKTTALRLIAGVLEPSTGWIHVGGEPIGPDPGWRKRVGYLPDEPPLYGDMDVRPYLEHVARLRGLDAAEARRATARVMERCRLDAQADRCIAALSHGHRQRVGLAQALVHEPELVLLDEPAAGLDPAQTASLRRILTSLGEEVTVVLASHLLGEVARTCTRWLVLEAGRLVVDRRVATGPPRVRVAVAPDAEAADPEAVLVGALGPEMVEREATGRFVVPAARRTDACRALLDAGHELVALETAHATAAELEALFVEEGD